jgi:hypothetical protein
MAVISATFDSDGSRSPLLALAVAVLDRRQSTAATQLELDVLFGIVNVTVLESTVMCRPG